MTLLIKPLVTSSVLVQIFSSLVYAEGKELMKIAELLKVSIESLLNRMMLNNMT